jgi:hypothetical protein
MGLLARARALLGKENGAAESVDVMSLNDDVNLLTEPAAADKTGGKKSALELFQDKMADEDKTACLIELSSEQYLQLLKSSSDDEVNEEEFKEQWNNFFKIFLGETEHLYSFDGTKTFIAVGVTEQLDAEAMVAQILEEIFDIFGYEADTATFSPAYYEVNSVLPEHYKQLFS